MTVAQALLLPGQAGFAAAMAPLTSVTLSKMVNTPLLGNVVVNDAVHGGVVQVEGDIVVPLDGVPPGAAQTTV